MKPSRNHWFTAIYAFLAIQIRMLGTWGLILYVLALSGLGWLSWEIWEKETFFFDTALLMRLHHGASPLFNQLMLDITQLGNPVGAVGTAVIILGWLLWRQQFLEFGFFAIASLGAVLLDKGLKLIFTRPRPTLWESLIQETSYSFPSGHALGSMVLYGSLAYLLARSHPSRSPLIYGTAAVMIILIGLSRLYLGVHYPTDIIAGYIIGFLWLRICIAIFKYVGHSQEVTYSEEDIK